MDSGTTAARLDRALKTAGIPISGVSIDLDRSTWRVLYLPEATEAQRALGATIVATFNPDDPALDLAELDTAVKAELDSKRLTSAVIWALIDQFAAPATPAKYQAARTKIIAAYKGTPWKP